MTAIYKGDDTNAFGEHFLRINRPSNTDDFIITKVVFQCGPIQKVFSRPQFPITVDFTAMESKRLRQTSECYLQVFDEKGRRKTCEGTISFTARPQVISDDTRRIH
mgnify:CR=1 FL=1